MPSLDPVLPPISRPKQGSVRTRPTKLYTRKLVHEHPTPQSLGRLHTRTECRLVPVLYVSGKKCFLGSVQGACHLSSSPC